MLRTKPSLRVLRPADLSAALALLSRDPVVNVFVDHRVRVTGLDPRWVGGEVWGFLHAGELVSLCHAAANIVPVAATPEAAEAFAARALTSPRTCASIMGPESMVDPMWQHLEPYWGPPRELRAAQPYLVVDRPPKLRPDPLVRRVREEELDLLYPASVAMFTEEVGVSPELDDGRDGYRARVLQLIRSGLAFARMERGEVVFKAEIGAYTPYACQIQGVWVHPGRRGEGLAAPALSTVVATALRDVAPVVALSVNAHNEPARRAYARIGFVERDLFTTVLF
jgi:uncharacterized protein